jgi:uncharacterized protein (UPF0335 family)
MGGFDFTWNAIQSGQIRELEERIEKLEEQNQILYEWVQYFKSQLKVPTNDQP